MQNPLIVYSYRYYLFGMSPHRPTTMPVVLTLPQVITIISNAIICSAAAWNLPISQNADLHSTSACNDEKKGVPR
jgi:hypothetical protein